MRSSRRRFLNTAALTAAGVALSPWKAIAGYTPTPAQGAAQRGMLFDKADIPRIRETLKLPRFAAYWRSVVDADLEADKKFLRTEVRLNNHAVDFLRVRQILERTSFAYTISGDKRHLEVALMAIGKMLEYKKWDYFLEGGEFTMGLQRAPEATIAMSFALEWLNDDLSGDLKKEMEKQIGEKGAPACYRTLYGMKYPDRVRGWKFDPESDYPYPVDMKRWPLILNSTNLKVIPICGLGVGACLLYDKHPQAKQWLNLAISSAKAFAPMFGTDGCYDEGVSYWGYTALHITMFLEIMYRTLGIDERGLMNFPGTVRYGLQMSMPTIGKPDDCVNFGDASVVGDVSVAAWVAHRNRDPIAQYVTTSVSEIKTHYGPIWYDPSIVVKTPGPELYDVRFANDIVVSRTGWDTDSSVVALRSGGPANHEHADRNSVIFKAYGERLLHDPLKAAYPYTLPHWVLRLTEAHTAVLINGKGHQYHDGHEGTNASWAEASVIQYKPSPHTLVVTSDATEAYRLVNPDVSLVRRTVVFLKPDILLLFDRVKLVSAKSKVQLRFQVYNGDGKGETETMQTGFLIKRPQATLQGTIIASTPFAMKSGVHTTPKEVGVYPYLEAEAGESLDHQIMTVCTAQRVGKEHGKVTHTAQGTVLTVKVEHNGQSKTVTVRGDEDLPTVTII
ncbi:MAG: heparinase II/III family protein [Ignavibacteria bacterium]|nr:heparinase II/III family protein [Ignavibacteria bacterium]